VHSQNKIHNREGVKAADQLLQLKADEEQQLMYLAAVGTYNLGRMVETRKRLKAVLAKYPEFGQSKTLLEAVEDKLTSDTLLAGGALAAVGGIAAVVVGSILASGSRR
jgi:Fis1 C-terminal tetratricopeptide repeat